MTYARAGASVLPICQFLHGLLLQTLLFDGKTMLDPLSLADCKGITCGGQNLITVQVSGHSSSTTCLPQVCECVLTCVGNAGQ